MSPAQPPRLARRILRRVLPADWHDDVVGDLEEVFRARCGKNGRTLAAAWFWWQAMAFSIRFSLQERRSGRARMLGDARRDLTVALRRVRRGPGFAAVVVLTLAFGLGANAAVFQIVDALNLRPLPVAEADRLAVLEVADATRWEGRRTSGHPVFSNALWEGIRDAGGPLEDPLAWASAGFTLESSGTPQVARGLYVSGGFFRSLGVGASIGRVFRAEDDRPGCPLEGAVLSHGFWERSFGGDPAVVGRSIVVNARDVPIIGVAAPGFEGLEVGSAFDVAVPICAQRALGGDEQWLDNAMVWWLTVVGRIPSGTTFAAANAELAVRSPGLFEATVPDEYPPDGIEDYLGFGLRVVPGEGGVSRLRSRYGEAMLALLGVTGFVLLIVCTNLANLFLARGSARGRELAVRRSLGASRTRLFAELAMESAVLVVAGAVGGIALAGVMGRYLLGFLGSDVSLDLSLGFSTVAFVAVAAGVSGAVFGVIPAWRASGLGGDRELEAVRDGRGAASSARGAGLRKVLVVSQVGMSFVLLFGALLFTATLRNLLSVDMGFDSAEVLVARVDFSAVDFAEEQKSAFKQDLLERIARIPGVVSVAEVRHLPLGGTGSSATVRVGPEGSAPGIPVRLNAVTYDYGRAMGISLIAGRWFDASDGADGRVAVVTPALAERLGLDANAVGATLELEGSGGTLQVIGLAPDAKYFTLREEPVATAFVPKQFLPDTRSYADFVIRTSTVAQELQAGVGRILAETSSQIWTEVRTFDETIRGGLLRERLMSTLAGFFGLLAAIVAAIGLYGVMSQHVSRRRRDIGVRLALGATGGDILRMVFREAGVLVVSGLVLGGLLAFVAAVPARSFVFGLSASSVSTYAATAMLLGATAAIACYLPARRAARTEPRSVLAAGD